MGCASTKVGNSPTVITSSLQNNNISSKEQGKQTVDHKTADKNTKDNARVFLDQNANCNSGDHGSTVKAAVAFEVPITDADSNSVSLIKKHPPKRLQALEPLAHPVLTADMLAEKQRLAEEKREKIMQKKASPGERASKRRRELEQAVLYSKSTQQQHIEDQLQHANALREAKQRDVIERQEIREERAMRVREKAKRLNEDYDIANVEMSAAFDEDDDTIENWLDDEKPIARDDTSERIYDGYASPKKAVSRVHAPGGSLSSASSTDSYERSFLPASQVDKQTLQDNGCTDDDFFDA